MTYRLSYATVRWLILLAAVLAYFVFFPDDLSTLLQPIHPLANAVSAALAVTQAVSPWLYALAAVALICWTIVRVWGRQAA
jgi:hypothetical protein